MPQFKNGQRLKGSDGQTYVVVNGTPMLESSVRNSIVVKSGDPNKAEEDSLNLQIKRAQLKKAQGDLPPDEAPIVPNGVAGEEFLKTLKPADQAIVKGLANGTIAFPTGAALRTPYWQRMLGNVVNYDPDFDQVNYGARYATRKDFTSGKGAQNIRALNTAIGHLGQLYSQIDGTASGSFTPLNALKNEGGKIFGSSGPTLYSQTAGALASELTQVFRGSGGAEADVTRYLSELDPNASLEQKKAAIKNIMGLLQSRLNAVSDQYTKGMGTTAQPLQLLDPHAQDVVKAISSGDELPSATGDVAAGASSSGAVPDTSLKGLALSGASAVSDVVGPDSAAPPEDKVTGSTDPLTLGRPGPTSGSVDTITDVAKDRYVSSDTDKKFAAIIQSAYNNKKSLADLDRITSAFNTRYGTSYAPVSTWRGVGDVMKSRDKFGRYGNFVTPETQLEKATDFQKDNAANAASPIGAMVIGAGDAVTGGLLDEGASAMGTLVDGGSLSDNLAEMRYKQGLLQAANPTAYTVGQIGGGLLQGVGAGAAVKKLGGGAVANVASDIGLSAAYGAGENNDDRFGGAGRGAVAGALGSVIGRGGPAASGKLGLNAAPRMLADEGVRTTLGQNLGKAGNAAEEFLAKVPIVGAPVAAARNRAFDDFQRLTLNRSLSSIGDYIPPKMKIGSAAMNYAQKSLGNAYDSALSNMKVLADNELHADIRDIGIRLTNGSVDEAVARRVQNIIKNQIGNKLAASGGALDGDTFKKTMTFLRNQTDTAKRTNNIELADTLRDVRSALENAARRASPPEAVAALDKADEGYALFVRAQKAAGAGSIDKAPGTFSPSELAGATKRMDGTVRSNAYLRGEALGQDWANAGQKVLGRPPEAGGALGRTMDRVGGVGLLGAGAAFAPKAVGVGAGLMTPYLPIARDLAGFATRPSAVRDRISELSGRPVSQALLQPWIDQ